MMAFQLSRIVGTGTFKADEYYQPLHEFVESDRQQEIWAMVAERYNAAQKRSAEISLVSLGIVSTLVVFACGSVPSRIADAEEFC